MKKLTKEEKQKLRGKIQEASAHRTARVLETVKLRESNDRGLEFLGIKYLIGVTLFLPPLGFIVGVYLLAKGRKVAGVCILAWAVISIVIFATGIIKVDYQSFYSCDGIPLY